jgi:molybdopterin-guanine dinucleotide biosynthesis protein A
VLSGIHAALSEARCELAVCIPVDTPLLTPQWIQLLARHAFARGAPACPRAGGRIHPIPGCWPRSVLPLVEAVLRSGNPAAHVALERSGASYVDEEAARAEGCDPAALANVNTQEEWEALLAASRLPG